MRFPTTSTTILRPMTIAPDAAQLLNQAISRLGTLRAVCDHTKLDKSALLRIKKGETKRPHARTIGLLTRAAYG